MADTSLIQFRLDTNLKDAAQKICNEIGIDMPTALRMFCKKMVAVGGIPFSLISMEKTQLAARWNIYDDARNEIQNNNIPDMTLDEINAEIAEVRKSLR